MQIGAQGIGERGVCIEMPGAVAEGFGGRRAQRPECVQPGDARGPGARAGLGMHRGAVGADPLMGDGAGILVQIPDRFFREEMLAGAQNRKRLEDDLRQALRRAWRPDCSSRP